MKRVTPIVTLACVLLGCGPGDEPVDDGAITPPERITRPTPSVEGEFEPGEAPDIERPVIDDVPESAPPDEVTCCEVAFVLPDAVREDDEVSAVLIGGEAPLDVEGGVPLTYSEGAWRANACVPPDYSGDYYYVVSIADENGDVVYESFRTNPNVPVGYSDTGEVNLWQTGETCDAIDVAVHALGGG